MTLQSTGMHHRELSGDTHFTHRDALEAALRDADVASALNQGMLLAIRQICAHARDERQGPERALVQFKLTLAQAANDAEMPLGPDRSDLLDRLVSTFIAELYDGAAKSGAKPRAFDCGDAQEATS